jgi:hypothetical protein
MVYTLEPIGVIFVLFMIYITYLQYKRKTLTKLGFFFWNIIWILGILLILFHTSVNAILPPLQIVRVMDLYMILAFMFLFAVIFYMSIRMRTIERHLEEITRHLALKTLGEDKIEDEPEEKEDNKEDKENKEEKAIPKLKTKKSKKN